MALVSVNVFLALGGEPIPPFTFQVSGANQLILKINSLSADKEWWSAGYVNAFRLDASLPTFRTLEKWDRLPLGNSFFILPDRGIYEIEIHPHDYLKDVRFLAWAI